MEFDGSFVKTLQVSGFYNDIQDNTGTFVCRYQSQGYLYWYVGDMSNLQHLEFFFFGVLKLFFHCFFQNGGVIISSLFVTFLSLEIWHMCQTGCNSYE